MPLLGCGDCWFLQRINIYFLLPRVSVTSVNCMIDDCRPKLSIHKPLMWFEVRRKVRYMISVWISNSNLVFVLYIIRASCRVRPELSSGSVIFYSSQILRLCSTRSFTYLNFDPNKSSRMNGLQACLDPIGTPTHTLNFLELYWPRVLVVIYK